MNGRRFLRPSRTAVFLSTAISCGRSFICVPHMLFPAGASSWHVRIRLCMDLAWWSQWHLVGERHRVSSAPSVSSCRRLAPRVQSQQHRGSHAVLFRSGESVAFIRLGKGQPYQLHDPVVLQSWNLNLLEPPESVQICTGIVLPFSLLMLL
jgi:hypothetical protein